MKTQFVLILFFLCSFIGFTQNLQVHYDFGEERKQITTTLEMFKPDTYGSTFFFVDMDYSNDTRNVSNGLSLAYWEIARSLKWSELQKWEPRVEYNGGVFKLNGDDPFIAIENAWLAGVQYTFNNADFSKILTVQLNYKYIQDKEDAAFQITAVWGLHFFDRKLSFMGFADFWKEEMFWGTDYRFLTEPQIWYNFTSKFSAGSEIELSNNFVSNEFVVNPTLAVKWTF